MAIETGILIGNRITNLFVGGAEFTNLRMRFDIGVQVGGLKQAKIEIWGLRKETYQAFKSQDEVVFTLQERFAKTEMFAGFLYNIEQRRDDAEFVVTLHCWSVGGDNETETESLGENTTGSQGLDIIDNKFKGLDARNVVRVSSSASEQVNTHRFKTGGQWEGTPMAIIGGIVNDLGLQYVVDDRELYIFKSGENDPRHSGITAISAELGNMIGTPSVTGLAEYKRAQVEMSLDPRVRISTLVEVTSEYFSLSGDNLFTFSTQISGASGLYQVFAINHRGDTHADLWVSQLNLHDYTKGVAND